MNVEIKRGLVRWWGISIGFVYLHDIVYYDYWNPRWTKPLKPPNIEPYWLILE